MELEYHNIWERLVYYDSRLAIDFQPFVVEDSEGRWKYEIIFTGVYKCNMTTERWLQFQKVSRSRKVIQAQAQLT